MKLNNPDAPATKKQLWLLHLLTKEDTRDWKLTMQEASDKINELKPGNKVKPAKRDGFHYCVMYGYPPPNHHWSNNLWRWKASITTKDKKKALKAYAEKTAKPSRFEYALVECKAAIFARRMLQTRQRTESKFCRILKTTIDLPIS